MSSVTESADLTPPGQRRAQSWALAYLDERGRLARIAFRNAVFGVITLGLYRFWGKTHIRRHLWSHVSLAGEPFEYTGLAKELLLGFLIVLAFLIPLYAVSRFADLALVTLGTWAVVVKNIAFGLLLYWLLHLAIYRARRYRLTRTLWRGIRGAQTGSAIAYAFKAFGYSLITVITLGLAYPLLRARLYGIRMRNTWIGNRPFRFEGSTRPLVKGWLVAWLPVTVVIVLFVGISIAGTYLQEPAAADENQVTSLMLGGAGVAMFLLLPVALVLYVWYRAYEFRYLAGETTFEGLRFGSGLKARSLIWIYLSYWLASFGVLMLIGLTVGIAAAFIVIQGSAAGDPGTWQPNPTLGFIIGIPLFLVFFMVSSVLHVILVMRRLVMRICETLTISGEVDFEAIEQSALAAPGRGEGLADALDVGGV
ncbi:MAG: YjgN family protein [Kiloniellales bacterium]